MQSLIADRKELVLYAGYALVGIATFLLARMFVQEAELRLAQDKLDENTERNPGSGLVKFTRPFFTQYFVPIVRGKSAWEARRQSAKRKLVSAGLNNDFTPDEFIAFKLFLIIFFPLVLGVLKAMDLFDAGGMMILASGPLGWFYPDLWANSRIKSRQKDILRSMPFIVDLLALSTEAGLDFVGAIGKVVEKAKPSPLVDEFAQLLREVRVGASRQDALREMAIRVDMPQINSFVAILISSDQMGASIGQVLRQQSEQIRLDRMVAAEKAGAQAAQKIVIPLFLFIVPAVFIMIMGPYLLGYLGGGK